MDQGPLVAEEIEAGAKLAHEFSLYKPIKAAFWLKASGDEQRYLYLASDEIDDTNFHLAYAEVVRLANKIQSPYLDLFRVKVIGGDHPLARAAMDVNTRFKAPLGTRFGGTSFGGVSVDDVYLYPSPLPVAAA